MKKKKNKSNILFYTIIIVFISLIVSMTLGFAAFDTKLVTTGSLDVEPYGNVEITSVTQTTATGLTESSTPTISDMHVSFNLTTSNTRNMSIQYEVVLTNNSADTYIFNNASITSTVTTNKTYTDVVTYTIDGISSGDEINSRESKTFTITFNYNQTGGGRPTTGTMNIELTIDGTNEETGNILVEKDETTGDLSGTNTRTPLTLTVINTYEYANDVTLSLSNDNFQIVDASGNKITSVNIPSNTSQVLNYYISLVNTPSFKETPQTVSVIANSTINVGDIDITVDVAETPVTYDTPQVGNVTLTKSTTKGSFNVSFTRTDTQDSNIKNYTIQLYDSNGNLKNTVTTPSLTYDFNNMEEGSYYVVVYGTDEDGNTGASYASTATTSSGYASKSETVEMKWTYSVTNNLTYMSSSGSTSVDLGTTYSATLTANNNYTLPTSITVTMNGTTLTSGTDYTYNSNNGSLSIPNVTGDITITGTATGGGGYCLVEGTKILLENNTYKNIEDITYYDLLKVFNLDNGTLTKEYPIWIEKKGTSNTYKEITFSDGTILKTVGSHGIYSKDLNRFIDVEDSTNFHIGTNILEYKNNKIETVTVTSIETKYEQVNYYQVISTTYYNIISNNIITTDGHIDLVNIYDFKEDLTWNTNREDILKDNNNLFTYKELSDVIPKYMFIGLRANETKYLLKKYNITNIDELKTKLLELNNNILNKYSTKNNIRYFIVSTSTNKTTKVKEDSYYKLPKDKNIKYWLNTTNNKKYKPGSKVKIELSTYFEAIK